MKLYLVGHDYKYAAEQIMLVMFPSERPEYPDKYEDADNSAVIKISAASLYTTASVKIRYDGNSERAVCRVKNDMLKGKLVRDRLLSRIIKNAFYKAAVRIKGSAPPWGSLTGIRPGKIATALLESGQSDDSVTAVLEREYYVSPDRAKLCIDTAKAGLRVKNSLGKRDVAVYIGIPFCPTRCAYCSFVSQSVEKSAVLIEPFLEALEREIDATAKIIDDLGLRVIAVYFGGGTPTTLSAAQLGRLIDRLYSDVDMSALREFTVEAGRPDTITADRMEMLKKRGVTRVSVNPQTMSDKVLDLIGRRHSAEDVFNAYDLVRRAGIKEINMDLIAGLPGDTAEGFSDTMDKVLSLSPENVTVHTLSLKKGAKVMMDKMEIPDGSVVGEMLDICSNRLRSAGYVPYYLYRQKFISGGYENVGWAKTGCYSLYNILIMEELCSVIALGGGASTKLTAPASGRIERIFNPKYTKEYIERIDTVIEKKEYIRTFYETEVL